MRHVRVCAQGATSKVRQRKTRGDFAEILLGAPCAWELREGTCVSVTLRFVRLKAAPAQNARLSNPEHPLGRSVHVIQLRRAWLKAGDPLVSINSLHRDFYGKSKKVCGRRNCWQQLLAMRVSLIQVWRLVRGYHGLAANRHHNKPTDSYDSDYFRQRCQNRRSRNQQASTRDSKLQVCDGAKSSNKNPNKLKATS